MKSIFISKHGGPEVLQFDEQPDPRPNDREVVVSIKATAINRLDTYVRAGIRGQGRNFPPPLILGGDASGIVVGLGKNTSTVNLNQRVLINPRITCGLCEFCSQKEDDLCQNFHMLGSTTNGSHAEYVAIPESNVYPINFAIPKEKIADTINQKPLNVLAPLIPGKKSSHGYKSEQDYYKRYQDSIFALTCMKLGWDSLRHYEILMNGCIPLFLNIDKCPENSLTSLPKKLLYNIFKQYSWILNQFFPTKIYKKKFLTIEKFSTYFFNLFKKKHNGVSFVNSYPEIIEMKQYLIDYTKKNLTTENTAKKIISETIKNYT